MSFMDRYPVSAVMYVWQGGMVGGAGTAAVLTGEVSPSGKLPDTIAYEISDYPRISSSEAAIWTATARIST